MFIVRCNKNNKAHGGDAVTQPTESLMNTSTQNTTNPGFSPEELRAAIRAGEELRSETIYQAFSAAFSYLKQVPSRLHLTGTQRHA